MQVIKIILLSSSRRPCAIIHRKCCWNPTMLWLPAGLYPRQNLSPPSHTMPILTSPRPRGAAIRRYAVGGAGAAPAGGVTTHSREASGHRPGGTTAPVRGARWKAWRHRICGAKDATRPAADRKRLGPFRDHPLHETKEIAQASLPNWRRGSQVSETPCRISAARRLKNAGKRSATGRADGGSIHPRRILAQWKRLRSPAPRGAPLPLIDQRTRHRGRGFGVRSFSPRGRRCLRSRRMREGHAPVQGDPHPSALRAATFSPEGRRKGAAPLNPPSSSFRRRSPSSSDCWRRRP